MSTLQKEFWVFAAFYTLALVAHTLHTAYDLHKQHAPLRGHVFALCAACLGKAIVVTFHEYAAHFVVYSGLVLTGH